MAAKYMTVNKCNCDCRNGGVPIKNGTPGCDCQNRVSEKFKIRADTNCGCNSRGVDGKGYFVTIKDCYCKSRTKQQSASKEKEELHNKVIKNLKEAKKSTTTKKTSTSSSSSSTKKTSSSSTKSSSSTSKGKVGTTSKTKATKSSTTTYKQQSKTNSTKKKNTVIYGACSRNTSATTVKKNTVKKKVTTGLEEGEEALKFTCANYIEPDATFEIYKFRGTLYGANLTYED